MNMKNIIFSMLMMGAVFGNSVVVANPSDNSMHKETNMVMHDSGNVAVEVVKYTFIGAAGLTVVGTGVVAGALVGLMGGAVLGALKGGSGPEGTVSSFTLGFVLGAVGGAGAGAATGGLTGLAVAKAIFDTNASVKDNSKK